MGGVFEVYVKTHFSAAHRLEGYPGDCARTHGHNWVVEAYVRCSELNEIGIGMDFTDIKRALKEVLFGLDHFELNELEPFQTINPTSENIARYIHQELSRKLNCDTVRVSKIKVCETPGAGAYYWED